jgi:hypothetical protein
MLSNAMFKSKAHSSGDLSLLETVVMEEAKRMHRSSRKKLGNDCIARTELLM